MPISRKTKDLYQGILIICRVVSLAGPSFAFQAKYEIEGPGYEVCSVKAEDSLIFDTCVQCLRIYGSGIKRGPGGPKSLGSRHKECAQSPQLV